MFFFYFVTRLVIGVIITQYFSLLPNQPLSKKERETYSVIQLPPSSSSIKTPPRFLLLKPTHQFSNNAPSFLFFLCSLENPRDFLGLKNHRTSHSCLLTSHCFAMELGKSRFYSSNCFSLSRLSDYSIAGSDYPDAIPNPSSSLSCVIVVDDCSCL